jgi:metal-responsive CopG/Arc/MetJ family transcriptional regulator
MKNVRMQFDLPENRMSELDELMARCDISTRKELFSYALSMLEWAVSEAEQGHDIAAIDREKKQFFSLRMPILSAAKRHINAG